MVFEPPPGFFSPSTVALFPLGAVVVGSVRARYTLLLGAAGFMQAVIFEDSSATSNQAAHWFGNGNFVGKFTALHPLAASHWRLVARFLSLNFLRGPCVCFGIPVLDFLSVLWGCEDVYRALDKDAPDSKAVVAVYSIPAQVPLTRQWARRMPSVRVKPAVQVQARGRLKHRLPAGRPVTVAKFLRTPRVQA